MKSPFFIVLLTCGFLLPIGACNQESADTIDEVSPAQLVIGDGVQTAEEQTDPPLLATANALNEEEEQALAVPDFNLPYPERIDLFDEPDVELVSQPDNVVGEGASALRLKGFIDVRGEQALVMWKGRIRAVSEGDNLGEVEVIEIAPPEIRLQRGRVRWVESLHVQGG